MQRALILQKAMNKFCSELLTDLEFVHAALESAKRLKSEFGKGFSFTNLGEYSFEEGKIIHPDTGCNGVWLDEESTRRYISPVFVDAILNVVNDISCPDGHELFVFMGSILNDGIEEKESKYIIYTQSFCLSNTILSPSIITDKQIEKRLRRMAQQGIKLLTLDTMHPDMMGDNLGRWMRAIEALKLAGGHRFSVIINSSGRFPGLIPPELVEQTLSININN